LLSCFNCWCGSQFDASSKQPQMPPPLPFSPRHQQVGICNLFSSFRVPRWARTDACLIWCQITAVPGQRRRSGDNGGPVPCDRRRGRRWRALASSATASAAEAAARLGQRRRHELAAAAAPSATDHRRRHRSCSIITIPSLRHDARPDDELGSAEWVPLGGQTHLEQQGPATVHHRLPRQGDHLTTA
jgi:hypothetical protein